MADPQSSTPSSATTHKPKPNPVVIKKYANRRLYNTASSTYVTLESLAEMVKDNIDFIVVDAKTGDDLTRPVLTQIIVDQESKGGETGQNLLPIPFLRQLISLYGGNMQWFVPNYLEETMRHFTQNQQRLQDFVQQTQQSMTGASSAATPGMGNMGNPMAAFQQMGQQISRQMVDQNRALMEQAQSYMMKMFMPLATMSSPNVSHKDKTDTLDALKQKVASLEAELKGME